MESGHIELCQEIRENKKTLCTEMGNDELRL